MRSGCGFARGVGGPGAAVVGRLGVERVLVVTRVRAFVAVAGTLGAGWEIGLRARLARGVVDGAGKLGRGRLRGVERETPVDGAGCRRLAAVSCA